MLGLVLKVTSHVFGKMAHLQLGLFSLVCNYLFVKFFKLNMSEAEKKLSSYKSLGELFVRKLRPNAREIQAPPLHPCDSTITTFGEINNSTLIGAKGVSYSLEKFLNTKKYSCTSGVSTYRYFITYYLSPRDYHRVHSPVDGVIKRAYKISGQLWPVNRTMVKLKKDLFIVNERLIVEIETREGKKVCVVFVGATNVGCIKISFDSKLVTPVVFDSGSKNYSINISAGDELGMFSLGSTVVVLYSENLSNIRSGYVYCNSSINF